MRAERRRVIKPLSRPFAQVTKPKNNNNNNNNKKSKKTNESDKENTEDNIPNNRREYLLNMIEVLKEEEKIEGPPIDRKFVRKNTPVISTRQPVEYIVIICDDKQEAASKLRKHCNPGNLCTCKDNVDMLEHVVERPSRPMHVEVTEQEGAKSDEMKEIISTWLEVHKRRNWFDTDVSKPTLFFKFHDDTGCLAYFTLVPDENIVRDEGEEKKIKVMVTLNDSVAKLVDRRSVWFSESTSEKTVMDFILGFTHVVLGSLCKFCVVMGYLRNKNVTYL